MQPATETPRRNTFCSFTILNRRGILVVPDARKDFRFAQNTSVVGPPYIRFYAGTALLAPEGVHLGTLCVIDTQVREDGSSNGKPAFSAKDEEILQNLGKMVVAALVERRRRLQAEAAQEKDRLLHAARLVACTVHDLRTPIESLQASLFLLECTKNRLQGTDDSHNRELLHTATLCSDQLIRVYRELTAASIDHKLINKRTMCRDRVTGAAAILSSLSSVKQRPDVDPAKMNPYCADTSLQTTKLRDIAQRSLMVTYPFPRQVPVFVTFADDVPDVIQCSDLKLLRIILEVISRTLKRTKTGYVHLRVYLQVRQGSMADLAGEKQRCLRHIVYECTHTRSNNKFQLESSAVGNQDEISSDFRYSSTAWLIESLGGEYGFKKQQWEDPDESNMTSTGSLSVFWFSIPLFEPVMYDNGIQSPNFASRSPADSVNRSLETNIVTGIPAHNIPATENNRPKRSRLSIVNERDTKSNFNMHIWDDYLNRTRGDKLSKDLDSFTENIVKRSKKNCPSDFLSMSSTVEMKSTEKSNNRVLRVLVIEDSLVIRKAIASALKKLGFEAKQAVNGLEGLHHLMETMYDFVLCDFLMPVMDGLDCAQQYRAWERENRVGFRQVIIGISAHANLSDQGAGEKAGMDDFRAKPITITMLREIVELGVVKDATRALNQIESQHLCQSNSVNGTGHVVRNVLANDVIMQDRDARATNSNSISLSKRPVDWPSGKRSCLFVSQTANDNALNLRNAVGDEWDTVVTGDYNEAIAYLKMRNWTVVFLDDLIAGESGFLGVTEFRAWEQQNRGYKQEILLCIEGDIPAPNDTRSIVQLPIGIDGVLRRPLKQNHVEYVLKRCLKSYSSTSNETRHIS
jgi:CheY-like chemotaxis protein/signal transduction histidine kinase